MKTSHKIFATAFLIPICFNMNSSLLLHRKYQRSTDAVEKLTEGKGILNAQEIYDGNFDHIPLPDIHSVKLQGRRGLFPLC